MKVMKTTLVCILLLCAWSLSYGFDAPPTVSVKAEAGASTYYVYPCSSSSITLGSSQAKSAPVSGTATTSVTILWTFIAEFSGQSTNAPTASGQGSVKVTMNASAAAGSFLNCSASAEGISDSLDETVSVSGAQTSTHNANGEGTYTVNGSSLTFIYDATAGIWRATASVHSTATSASATATAPIGSKGSSSSASGTATLVNTDILVGTLMVTPH